MQQRHKPVRIAVRQPKSSGLAVQSGVRAGYRDASDNPTRQRWYQIGWQSS